MTDDVINLGLSRDGYYGSYVERLSGRVARRQL